MWDVLVLEQALRQLSAGCPRVEQLPEALELVEDHKVGLQGVQAGVGQEPPELRYEPASDSPRLRVRTRGQAIAYVS